MQSDDGEGWTVYAFADDRVGEGWRPVTTKATHQEAAEARSLYEEANPGALVKIDRPGRTLDTWSVYQTSIPKGSAPWVWLSDWATHRAAQVAAKVRRNLDSGHVYDVFVTGQAPDPSPEQVTQHRVDEHRSKAERIAQQILDGQRGDANMCPARVQSPTREEPIYTWCVYRQDHHPQTCHQTAYQVAVKLIREREADVENRKLGGGPAGIRGSRGGRFWNPPSASSGSADYGSVRFEGGSRDVTPAGDGFSVGGPPNRKGLPPREEGE
jgi:hypothetical protein